jgi:hypothetical protein
MSKEIDPKALVVRSGKRSGAQRVGYSGFPSNPTVRGSAAIIPDYWFSNLPFKPQVGRDLGEGPPIHQEHGEQCGRLGIAHGRARQLVAQLHADRTNCAPLLAYRNAKGYTVRSNRAVERQRHHCRRRARPKRNIARRSPRPTRQSRGSGSWRSVWCSTRPPGTTRSGCMRVDRRRCCWPFAPWSRRMLPSMRWGRRSCGVSMRPPSAGLRPSPQSAPIRTYRWSQCQIQSLLPSQGSSRTLASSHAQGQAHNLR